MGYYIQGPTKGKAAYFITQYAAKPLTTDEARDMVEDPDFAPICIMDNGAFEAAGYAYSMKEFECFARDDGRPKKWVGLARELANHLSGLPEHKT